MAAYKYSISISDLIGLISFCGVVWSVISLNHSSGSLISIVGWFLGYSGFSVILLIFLATYLHLIDKVVSGVMRVLASFVVGLAFVQCIIFQKFEVLIETDAALPSLVIFLIWFGVRGYAFSEAVFHRFPMPEVEMRKLVTRLPPTYFRDLWPFHMFIALILVFIPFVVRLFWKI